MMRQLGVRAMVGLLLLGGMGAANAVGQHPAEPHSHPEGQTIENPVAASGESIARGRRLYALYCRQCHGVQGKGDGDMSHAGGVSSDFTDERWQHGSSAGEVFLAIRDGVSADMQPYGARFEEEDLWHLVNFVRSLSPSARTDP